MKKISWSVTFAAAALLFGGAGVYAADVAGSSDHPLVGRYDGSEIVGYTVTEYDEANLVEGPFDADEHQWRYRLQDGRGPRHPHLLHAAAGPFDARGACATMSKA